MIETDLPNARRLAFSVVLGQAAVTVIASLLCRALLDPPAAESAAIGGGIGTIASLVMALASVCGTSTMSPERAVRALLLGEAIKVAVIVMLFVLVLRVMRVAPLAMFAAFAATFVVYWIALLSARAAWGGARRGAWRGG
ncbi:MAG TPA: ATP synthase subunit I [Steroidobacteraceae bacterium]